jgi:hypothetical protein
MDPLFVLFTTMILFGIGIAVWDRYWYSFTEFLKKKK